MWVIAMDEFSKVYKDVEPKIRKATEAEAILKEVMAVLKQKQLQLAAVEAELKVIQMQLEEKNRQLKVRLQIQSTVHQSFHSIDSIPGIARHLRT